MSDTIVTVEMDDSLKVVKDIFDNTKFHHLLVVERGKLYGVISDRDLFKALSPNIGTAAETDGDAATLNKKAHQIMTREPITLSLQSKISDVVRLFGKYNISCIPVIDTENRPAGIISWRDLLRHLGPNLDSLLTSQE